MLQWFRARARPVAATTLVALATLGAWSAAPHQQDCHDAVCASAVVPHDPSAHRVGRDAAADERPLHCVLCHWTRIVRPSGNAGQQSAPVLERSVRFVLDSFNTPQAVRAARPPLRAPPSSPLPQA